MTPPKSIIYIISYFQQRINPNCDYKSEKSETFLINFFLLPFKVKKNQILFYEYPTLSYHLKAVFYVILCFLLCFSEIPFTIDCTFFVFSIVKKVAKSQIFNFFPMSKRSRIFHSRRLFYLFFI